MTSYGNRAGIDTERRSYRYYRNAVERHWDPHDIDLSTDTQAIDDLDEAGFDNLRRTLALFGAGEEAVTEDLAPLSVVLEDTADQLFVTTQLYDEAKHADFFDRYWREVINEAERSRGLEPSSPTEQRWFVEGYEELFERNHDAMHRLLDEDTPENRAIAFCHYHLTVEGILAQTGYYGLQSTFDGSTDAPELPGLVEGLTSIRGDEGRHVGFGMAKLKGLIQDEGIDPQLLHDTVAELATLTQTIVREASSEETAGPSPDELVAYTASNHTDRMEAIVDATELPDLETLTSIEGES